MIVPVINTHSSCRDIWDIFFGQLKKHFPISKAYVFVDKCDYVFPEYVKVINYDKNKCFTEQYIDCIEQVDEEICLYLNEDYIFYDTVNVEKLIGYSEFLKTNKDIHFIKLLRGIDNPDKMVYENLYEIPLSTKYLYTQQPTLWKTETLKFIHNNGPKSGIGVNSTLGHFEVEANDLCRKNNIKGLFYYNGEPKRGMHHYDSSVLNCVLSAIVKGKWNISEYEAILVPLFKYYKINYSKRGVA